MTPGLCDFHANVARHAKTCVFCEDSERMKKKNKPMVWPAPDSWTAEDWVDLHSALAVALQKMVERRRAQPEHDRTVASLAVGIEPPEEPSGPGEET
jgi:hypothetical protein